MSRFVHAFVLISTLTVVSPKCFASEYRIYGKVTTYWFDKQGNATTKSKCDFVWHRKNALWRVDVLEPDGRFPSGVWHSVLPSGGQELVSLRTYPTTATQSNSSAFVEVLTNRFVPPSIHGAHAVWLALNRDQILSEIGPSGECPPFWLLDPKFRGSTNKSHLMFRTNNAIVFLNRGRKYILDENGRSRAVEYPAPFNKGFKQAELLFSQEQLDERDSIPKRVELSYVGGIPDVSQPSGFAYQIGTMFVVENESIHYEPLAEAVFSPSWTNSVAVVVDRREQNDAGQSLSYTTRDRRLDLSAEKLQKMKALDAKMKATGVSKSANRLLPLVLLCIACILPLALWCRAITKKQHPSTKPTGTNV
ncbi:MAG: hypothetical protein KIS67_24535 [Verrucomicrobiae bacterium]|nr:hypothetical protein [Verrucomicrobiae bacterium]